MNQPIRILPHLQLSDLHNPILLQSIYLNMEEDYYWSDDYSPEFYATLAKYGFMAVTEIHKGEELLLPELQKRYAILDFDDLHISTKVKRLISKNEHSLHIGLTLDRVHEEIGKHHSRSWLTPKYLEILKSINKKKLGMTIVAVTLKHKGGITAGELGYIIGSTYTSLSGFSSRDPRFRNNGTLQLVMLAQWLKKYRFSFWNLGQPYMPYKFTLGAKEYHRDVFLDRWLEASKKPLTFTVK